MPKLPDRSFDEIAIDLKLYADSGASAYAAGEVMAARGGWAGGFNHSLHELRTAAELSGELYQFFRDAARYEETIRDFLAGLDASLAAEDAQPSARLSDLCDGYRVAAEALVLAADLGCSGDLYDALWSLCQREAATYEAAHQAGASA